MSEEATATAGPAAAAFTRWQAMIAEVLEADGVGAERAARLSWLVISSLEGAVVMARAQRSPAPLDAVAEEMRDLIRAAVGT